MIEPSNIGRCATCKYWSKNPNQVGMTEVDGTYRYVLNSSMGACLHPKLHEDTTETPDPDSVVFSGAYGYEADLEVGPDFGCIHHNGGKL